MGIEGLAAMSLKDPNQLKRRLAFSHLLSEMTSENAVQIREGLITAGVSNRSLNGATSITLGGPLQVGLLSPALSPWKR